MKCNVRLDIFILYTYIRIFIITHIWKYRIPSRPQDLFSEKVYNLKNKLKLFMEYQKCNHFNKY